MLNGRSITSVLMIKLSSVSIEKRRTELIQLAFLIIQISLTVICFRRIRNLTVEKVEDGERGADCEKKRMTETEADHDKLKLQRKNVKLKLKLMMI